MHIATQLTSLLFLFPSCSPYFSHPSLFLATSKWKSLIVLIPSELPLGSGTIQHDSVFETKPGEVLHLVLQKPIADMVLNIMSRLLRRFCFISFNHNDADDHDLLMSELEEILKIIILSSVYYKFSLAFFCQERRRHFCHLCLRGRSPDNLSNFIGYSHDPMLIKAFYHKNGGSS